MSEYKQLASISPDQSQHIQHKQRRSDQIRTILVIFCLCLATGPNFAWLFISKYLQTYLYFQMSEQAASPTVEISLYLSMVIVSSLFMPLCAYMLFTMPIKAVLCMSSVFLLTGSISFIVSTNVWTFIFMQSAFTAVGTSLFQITSFLLAWEWFSPERRGLLSGLVVSFQSFALSMVIAFQIFVIEYKNLAPLQDYKLFDDQVDIFPQQIAMKLIMLYFVMCGVQGIVTAVVLAFASRNDVQVAKETRYAKNELRVSLTQRQHIRRQLKRSNANKQANEVLIYHPGQNFPAQYLNFSDALRARQVHILWFMQFCLSSCTILFCVQVIHTCSQVIDKSHAFCKANLIANLTAAFLSPFFGLFNDYGSLRINSAIGMLGLAALTFFMAEFELYTESMKLWFLIAVHIFLSWQQTTISYACVRLFGVKCGTQILSYISTAAIAAAVAVLPLVVYGECFGDNTCENIVCLSLGGILVLGFLLSLVLNPKPLVHEDSNQFARPIEQYTFVSTHNEIQF